MAESDYDTQGGAGPDQVVAPEPAPVRPEEATAATAVAPEGEPAPDAPVAEAAPAQPAVATDDGSAGVSPAGPQSPRAARGRTQTRSVGGRLWAAAEARRATEGEPESDSDEADEAVHEAEEAVLADLAKLAAERDDYLDQLRRTKADFENYRKRILRQQTEHLERAAEALAEKLLPVLDTFDAALVHGQGFEQVHAALMSTLEKEGLERIAPEGKPFDPNESDAVAHEEGDGGPVVAEVLRPGYRWKGRVLRPAMVRVRG